MDLDWAPNLGRPSRVHAKGPELDPVSTPPLARGRLSLAPSRAGALHLTWHGNRTPEILRSLRTEAGEPIPCNSGQCFIGSKGILVSRFTENVSYCQKTHSEDIPAPRTLHREFHQVTTRNGPKPSSREAAPLVILITEPHSLRRVRLGSVSYRRGEAIDYVAESANTARPGKARDLLHKECRRGWFL